MFGPKREASGAVGGVDVATCVAWAGRAEGVGTPVVVFGPTREPSADAVTTGDPNRAGSGARATVCGAGAPKRDGSGARCAIVGVGTPLVVFAPPRPPMVGAA